MKYTTLAALMPLPSAANVNTRQGTDVKFEITNFTAACTSDSYCFYGIGSIVNSNNPDFSQGCGMAEVSDNGHLPASELRCGTDKIWVDTTDDGGLVLTVRGDQGRLTGTHTISSDELKTETSGGEVLQSYVGDPDFTIDANDTSSSGSSSATTALSTTTASTSSDAPTATGSSTTGSSSSSSSSSTTGSATSSSTSASETNGTIRESASTAALFICSLFGFGFLL